MSHVKCHMSYARCHLLSVEGLLWMEPTPSNLYIIPWYIWLYVWSVVQMQSDTLQCSAVQCSALQCSEVQYSVVQCSLVYSIPQSSILECGRQLLNAPVFLLPPALNSAHPPPSHPPPSLNIYVLPAHNVGEGDWQAGREQTNKPFYHPRIAPFQRTLLSLWRV